MVTSPRISGPLWTTTRYPRMERENAIRHEFVDGYVYAMAGGTKRHGAISANVIASLGSRLAGTPCYVYTSDVRVQVTPTRYFYPDASVSCDARDNDASDDENDDCLLSPCLIVEVLSRSNESYDRSLKFALYQGSDMLRDYLLVESYRMSVSVHHRDEGGSWSNALLGPGDTVVIESIGLHTPISDFYVGSALLG